MAVEKSEDDLRDLFEELDDDEDGCIDSGQVNARATRRLCVIEWRRGQLTPCASQFHDMCTRLDPTFTDEQVDEALDIGPGPPGGVNGLLSGLVPSSAFSIVLN
jgi:Ca2+-binding EF-hand superfamily protein